MSLQPHEGFGNISERRGRCKEKVTPYAPLPEGDDHELFLSDFQADFAFRRDLPGGVRRLLAVDFQAALLDEPPHGRLGGERRRNQGNHRDQVGLAAQGAPRHFACVLGELLAGKSPAEPFRRIPRGLLPVEACDDLPREGHFRLHRMPGAVGQSFFQRRKAAHADVGEELVILQHQVVGDGHHFPEDRFRRLRDADVVAQALAHLVHAVQPHEQRRGHHHLRLLSVHPLQVAPHEEVELLVGSPQLHVRPKCHRVVSLEQGIEELVDGNRALPLVPPPEVVPLEHPRHRHLRGDPDQLLDRETGEPLGVEPDLGLRWFEDLENLLLVGRSVALDVLPREDHPRLRLPGGVADHPGEVADQEDHLMAGLLEVLELLDEDGVAEVQVRRGGVESRLDAQRPPLLRGALELSLQLLRRDNVHRAALQGLENLIHSSVLLIRLSLMTNGSTALQKPLSASMSKNRPAASGSPAATSNRVGTWRRNRRRTPLGSMPITEGEAPHIPASVMYPVPPGRTWASTVWTWVCVPAMAATLPSRWNAIARFSDVASAWKSTRTAAASSRISGRAASIQRKGQSYGPMKTLPISDTTA